MEGQIDQGLIPPWKTKTCPKDIEKIFKAQICSVRGHRSFLCVSLTSWLPCAPSTHLFLHFTIQFILRYSPEHLTFAKTTKWTVSLLRTAKSIVIKVVEKNQVPVSGCEQSWCPIFIAENVDQICRSPHTSVEERNHKDDLIC